MKSGSLCVRLVETVGSEIKEETEKNNASTIKVHTSGENQRLVSPCRRENGDPGKQASLSNMQRKLIGPPIKRQTSKRLKLLK